MRALFKDRFLLLSDPAKGFEAVRQKTLETAVHEHMKLLLVMSFMASVIHFSYFVLRAIYYSMFFSLDIRYSRMLNYGLGIAGGAALFYVIAGTLLVIILSLVVRMFFKSVKYTVLLKTLLYAITPLLFFAWYPGFIIPLGLWSIFLFRRGKKEWS